MRSRLQAREKAFAMHAIRAEKQMNTRVATVVVLQKPLSLQSSTAAHDFTTLALRANGLPLAGALRLAAAAAAALPGSFSGCSSTGLRANGLPPPPAALPGRDSGEGALLALPAVAAAGLA